MGTIFIGIIIAYAVLGLWIFHKVFTVYYFNVTNAIIKELIGAGFFSFIMTFLTLKYWVAAIIFLLILGLVLAAKANAPGTKGVIIVAFIIVAILVGILGKNVKGIVEESNTTDSKTSYSQQNLTESKVVTQKMKDTSKNGMTGQNRNDGSAELGKNETNVTEGNMTVTDQSQNNKKKQNDNNSSISQPAYYEINQNEKTTEQETNQKNESAEMTENKKKMVTYQPEGSICSIEALPDGTFLWLEIISDRYHIKTSNGMDRLLTEVSGSYGCRLSYDRYSEKLYLFEYSGKSAMIYEVDTNFELKKVATFVDRFFSDGESDLVCSFFSDGMVICNSLSFKLIDSRTWTVVGKVPGAVYVINDRMYQRGSKKSSFFREVDAQENVLNEYAADGFQATVWESQVYQDGRYAYFIATEGSCENVYRFDGEGYEKIACLNDYKYYAPFNYNYLCVTGNAIRCYDTDQKVMKEFLME